LRRSDASSIRTAKIDGRAEGRVEGIQEVFALLEQGYSLAEAKKKLRLE